MMQAILTSLPFSISPDDSDPEQDHLVGIGPHDDEPEPDPSPDDKHRQH